MGIQVKAFSTRIDRGVVRHDNMATAIRAMSRASPFTGISMPSPMEIITSRFQMPLAGTVTATAMR